MKQICFYRTSDQLLEELFGVFGANVPDLLRNSEKRSKKKKKRKHDDSEAESPKSKHKKSKKPKKVKQELNSDKEDSKEHIQKLIKKERREKTIKKEVTERRKLSIVIKDLKFRSEIAKPSSSTSTRENEKKRKSKDREKDRKSREKKSSGNVSDISLSDDETYRKMLEYHTSSQWLSERNNHIREWDRDKYRRERSREDDRQ